MRMLLAAVAALVLMTTVTQAQDLSRTYTRPAVPPREALDRLNLQADWYTYVPMEGRKDGLYTVQLAGKDVLIQTYSGLLVCLDRDTGTTRWRNRIAGGFTPSQRLGWNSTSVFVISGMALHALNRTTGQYQWSFELPFAATTAPAADDDHVYLGLGSGVVQVYQIRWKEATAGGGRAPAPSPSPGAADRPNMYQRGERTVVNIGPLSSGRAALAAINDELAPIVLKYEHNVEHRLEQAPLVTPEFLLFTTPLGDVFVMSKYRNQETAHFAAQGNISAPPGQYEETAYIGSHDQDLYALNIVTGHVAWRFTAPAPILRKPMVTDEDVYLAVERGGLFRLDRLSGDLTWRHPTAARFLASNPKFTYALDHSGRLLVLDRKRGTELSRYDVRDFIFPISNELTDRIFLAANDGLVLCLHDREYPTPLEMKKMSEPKPVPAPGKDEPKQPGDKPPAKPDEMKKPGGDKEMKGPGGDKEMKP